MRNFNLLAFSAILLLFSGLAASASRPGVAATVNGSDISETRLQNAVNNYIREQGSDIGAIRQPAEFKKIRARVLKVLVGQELLWQAAVEADLVAGDDDVAQAFERYRSQFEDELAFDNRLKSGGYNQREFRENLKRRLSAQNWVQANVLDTISVGVHEVGDFYAANKTEFATPAQVRARHILIKLDSESNEEDIEKARALLGDIRQRVAGGGDFAALAREYSQDGSAPSGGDLGYFGPGQMVKPFEQSAFALAPGEMSDIVATRFGLHLIQAVDRKPPSTYKQEDVAERIREHLIRQKYESAIDAAIESIKQQAEIEYHNV